jgi:hypothetical protein
MHDGYIFTLAICGTAAASSLAPALLNTMLAAIPPVKRAALLGEVVPLDQSGRLHDTLSDQVIADIRDAEVLFLVSPLYHIAQQTETPAVTLPERFRALLARAASRSTDEQWHGKSAALVIVDTAGKRADDGDDTNVTDSRVDQIVYKHMLLAPLQRFCVEAGIEVVGATIVSETGTEPDEKTLEMVRDLAQRAYASARQRLPHALPAAI